VPICMRCGKNGPEEAMRRAGQAWYHKHCGARRYAVTASTDVAQALIRWRHDDSATNLDELLQLLRSPRLRVFELRELDICDEDCCQGEIVVKG
jgi:hypothetical protein